MVEKEIVIEIKHPEIIVLLAFSLFFLILELQVTFGTKINFGDEGFHARFAQHIAENIEFPIFTVIEETKLSYGGFVRPPLFNLLGASTFLLFGTANDGMIRFLTPFIAIITGIVAFLLTKKLFDEKIAFITAILTMTIPSVVTYSVMFYTDVLYTFYACLFFLLFLLAVKENNRKYLICSGVFGGLALLTDLSGLATYIFVSLAIFYELVMRSFFSNFRKYLILILILALIPAGFFLRNIYYFGNPLCRSFGIGFIDKFFDLSKCSVNKFESKYQFAGRVEQVGTEQNVYAMGITNYLNFAYGNLWLVVFGFFAGLMLLLAERDKIVDLLIIYFILFLGLFYTSTSRAEDTARNTLGWVPMIALVSAKYFGEVYDFIKRYQKYVAVIVFIFVILLSYLNFKEKLDIMSRVKQFSPLFFEACDWIKANAPENSVLYTVWAHRAIYNCQRNSIGTSRVPDLSLSRDANYTIEVARQHGITHIFLQKFSIDYLNRHFAENYDWEYVQFLENNPEYFKKIYENGPSLQQCLEQRGCDGNVLYEIKL